MTHPFTSGCTFMIEPKMNGTGRQCDAGKAGRRIELWKHSRTAEQPFIREEKRRQKHDSGRGKGAVQKKSAVSAAHNLQRGRRGQAQA